MLSQLSQSHSRSHRLIQSIRTRSAYSVSDCFPLFPAILFDDGVELRRLTRCANGSANKFFAAGIEGLKDPLRRRDSPLQILPDVGTVEIEGPEPRIKDSHAWSVILRFSVQSFADLIGQRCVLLPVLERVLRFQHPGGAFALRR